MELPPGFRFHPTDEELITHYLSKKVLDSSFSCIAIGDVDMNKIEPWDLPWRANLGEKEWYFFCVRDKKYPTGLRTNRATLAGYWKATGKDKEIFRGKTLVGMKKTLVFYKGRAPRGEKSNWVTHEYRLEGKLSFDNFPKPAKNDWVISRVFHKTSGGKKVHISGLMRMNPKGIDSVSALPPLMDPNPPFDESRKLVESGLNHVHCFSNPMASRRGQESLANPFNNPMDSFPWGQVHAVQGGMGFPIPASVQFQDPSILRTLLGNYRPNVGKEMASLPQETGLSNEESSVPSNLEMPKKSFSDQEAPSASVGAQDIDCIWSY
ncbi:hypothetical protein F511_21735 [Dorcoceras hygrometricum]|uniref:NAC domain-containing protein n=1 Tax=Dorcoceras hygrometricum TaxID=472368 RepID=A0A2Z7BJ03_9LAMI|nr:hypothetical protein F511_21735 [Dorcoceras hygrometricum]